MAEPKTQYEYGRTPEETAPGLLGFFNMLSGPVADAFTPERREVITPSTTTYTEADGMYYPTTTPGVYGPPERGIENMPVVQGAKSAYEFLGELISSGEKRGETGDALVKGIGTLLEDQKRAGINAGLGGDLQFYDPEQKRVVTYDPLLTPATMGAAGALAPVRGRGVVLGMFAGRNAATADLDALKVAQKMETKGNSRDEIWDQTGWFRYQDREGKPMGEWKFEIPDDASAAVTDPAALKPYLTPTGRVKKGSGQKGRGPEIDKLLVHDELNKAYPGAGSVRVFAEVIRDLSNLNEATKKLQVKYGRGELTEPAFRQQYNLLLQQKSELQDLMQKGLPIGDVPGGPSKTVREQYPLLDRPIGDTVMESTSTGAKNLYGYYSPFRNAMAVRRDMGNTEQKRMDAFRSIALHELQHAIQEREGFETGGLPTEFGRGFKNRPVDPKTGKKLTPWETYAALVGETEARLVQDRRDLDLGQRRFIPPYSQIDESMMYTRKDLGVEIKDPYGGDSFSSNNAPIPKTPESRGLRGKLFQELANKQRDAPELLMVEAQGILGGGVLSHAIEHAGDLAHRIADKYDAFDGYGYDVGNKVDRVLRSLRSEYGFEKEFNENIRAAARYRGIPEKRLRDAATKALQKYADAHKSLRVYNEPQKWARDAAVALGEQRFTDAREHLSKLQNLIRGDGGRAQSGENISEAYRRAAGEFDPDFEDLAVEGKASGGFVDKPLYNDARTGKMI